MGTAWATCILGVAAVSASMVLWPARAAMFPGLPWPPGPSLAPNAARTAAALALGAAMVLLADALGRRVAGWTGARRGCIPVRLASPLVGYLAASTALLGASAVGLWFPCLLGAAGILAAALVAGDLRQAARDWADRVAAAWRESGVAVRAAGLMLAGWVVVLVGPPELALDCLTYDLAFPQQVLRAHRILGSDLYSHWAIPLPAEFPFVYPVMLGLDSAARVCSLLLAVIGGGVLWSALVPAGTPGRAAFGAAAVWLALVVPTARSGLVLAKSDSFAVGHAMAAAGLLLHAGAFARGRPRSRGFVLGALILGAAVAIKYLTLPLAAALAVVVLLRTGHAGRARLAALGLAAGALPILPWAAKAWLLEADPLPPMGAAVLPGVFGVPGTGEGIRGMFSIYLQDTRPRYAFAVEAVRIAIPNAWLIVAGAPWLGRLPAGTGVLLAATVLGYLGLVAGIRGAIEHVERFCHPVYAIWGLAGAAALATGAGSASRGGVRAAAAAALALGAVCSAGLARYEWWPGGSLQSLALGYHAGKITARGMLVEGTLAYGAILPEVEARVGAERPSRSVLAIGEIQYWNIPARVRTQVLGPPFAWRAALGAGSAGRIAIRFRQANVGWILYNAPLAGWGRFTYSPWDWRGDDLARYAEFARTRLRLAAFCGRSDPNYGSSWLFSVSPRRLAPAPRLMFIPGAERALTWASLAAVHGRHDDAILRFRRLSFLGPVASIESMLAASLLAAGRTGEAYPLLRRGVDEGLVDETNLLDLAVAAGRLGRKAEAEKALESAARAYPLWPDRVARARREAGL